MPPLSKRKEISALFKRLVVQALSATDIEKFVFGVWFFKKSISYRYVFNMWIREFESAKENPDEIRVYKNLIKFMTSWFSVCRFLTREEMNILSFIGKKIKLISKRKFFVCFYEFFL